MNNMFIIIKILLLKAEKNTHYKKLPWSNLTLARLRWGIAKSLTVPYLFITNLLTKKKLIHAIM